MFCPNCGTRNVDSAKFCESCGYNLMQEQPAPQQQGVQPTPQQQGVQPAPQQQGTQPAPQGAPIPRIQPVYQQPVGTPYPAPVQPAPKKPVSPAVFVILAEAAVLALLCFLCYSRIQTLNDPKTAVDRYMTAVMNGNYGEAYSYLDLPDSPYLTEESYERYMDASGMDQIVNYSIEKDESGKDRDSVRSYLVEVTRKGSTSSEPIRIQASRSREKRMLILDQWNLKAEDMVVEDVQIETSPLLTVSLDGITLDRKNSTVEDDGSQRIYTLPETFKGIHTMTVSGDGFVPYAKELEFSYDVQWEELEFPYVSEELFQELSGRAAESWNQLITGILAGADADTMPEELQDGYDYAYDIHRFWGSDDYTTEIQLTNLTASLQEFDYWMENPEIRITISADEVRNGVYVNSYNPALREELHEQGVGKFNVVYALQNEEWVLQEYDTSFSY